MKNIPQGAKQCCASLSCNILLSAPLNCIEFVKPLETTVSSVQCSHLSPRPADNVSSCLGKKTFSPRQKIYFVFHVKDRANSNHNGIVSFLKDYCFTAKTQNIQPLGLWYSLNFFTSSLETSVGVMLYKQAQKVMQQSLLF